MVSRKPSLMQDHFIQNSMVQWALADMPLPALGPQEKSKISGRSAAIMTFGHRDPAKRVGRISHTHKGLRRAQCEPIGRALAQPTMRLSHQISKASLLWHTNPAKNPGKQEQFGESQSILQAP